MHHDGRRVGRTTSELEELKALKRENRELKRANDIPETASAVIADAVAASS